MIPEAENFQRLNLDCGWKVFKKNMIDLEREAIRMRIDISTVFVNHIGNNVYNKLTKLNDK